MASRKYYWWHYIPFLLLLPILLVFYLDAWWGYQFLRLTSIVVFLLIAWTIFIVIRSIAIGGLHKKLIISLSALYVLAVIFLVAVRIPAWECNPEKLVKHYEQIGENSNRCITGNIWLDHGGCNRLWMVIAPEEAGDT